jgi:hypothetical protein
MPLQAAYQGDAAGQCGPIPKAESFYGLMINIEPRSYSRLEFAYAVGKHDDIV